jgi:hypothetical protein
MTDVSSGSVSPHPTNKSSRKNIVAEPRESLEEHGLSADWSGVWRGLDTGKLREDRENFPLETFRIRGKVLLRCCPRREHSLK